MSITSSTIGKRTFKIILLGDSSTGKTSIIERFVNNRFEEKDNVPLPTCSLLSASIFLAKMSLITPLLYAFSFGILQDKNDIVHSFRVISKMQFVLSSSSMSRVNFFLTQEAKPLPICKPGSIFSEIIEEKRQSWRYVAIKVIFLSTLSIYSEISIGRC